MRPERHGCVFAPDATGRVELPRWVDHARTFLGAELAMVQRLTHPDGVLPAAATLGFTLRRVGDEGAPTRVRVHTRPIDEAAGVREAGERAARAIGGAGMDALVRKATRAWMVEATPDGGGDARAPLVMAAVLAGVLLAPIVPPEGDAIFATKGARQRLDALGWPT